ncbi:redoxin domain-containing protein [Lacihabitans soyangensis]|uniref:Alkyl hydroperoxide reductase subunit C/ Thiol specific antioxidant domain-containing protein n=1 Tax=Lacihabitans soyangensis TaxID=869394 RepID=A0AAE3H6P4_9BACT|nr:redoxin domain-containing protein [Lacihabitans soyangensis]MCP9765447.1 hypothetical protein [Lacihabitans soyangensis]
MEDFDKAFWDTEIKISKPNVRIFPIPLGSKIPDFTFEKFWKSQNTILTKEGSFHKFCKSGVKVIGFLSPEWNNFNQNYIERLILCNEEISALGGQFSLFVNSESEFIETFLRNSPIKFNVCKDKEFSVARRFGVFDNNHQAWETITGISEDGPYPSIFIVNTDNEVIYSHVDIKYNSPFSFLEIAATVYNEKQKRYWKDENLIFHNRG